MAGTRPASFNLLARHLDSWPTPSSSGGRALRLALEGALYTACAILFAEALQIPQAGFFAIFLSAAGPTGRLEELLAQNRAAIVVRKLPAARANAQTALWLLSLFLGSFAVFLTAALCLGQARLGTAFSFVSEAARIGGDTILTRPFVSPFSLFLHNGQVLGVFFALAFVYRSYGALLSLSWNACNWGLVIAFLVRRGLEDSATHPAIFIPIATAAVLPHLVIEAAAYVLGALSAIFLSKGVMKYAAGDPVLRSVLRAAGSLSAIALGLLLLGALIEVSVPRLVLSLLSQ